MTEHDTQSAIIDMIRKWINKMFFGRIYFTGQDYYDVPGYHVKLCVYMDRHGITHVYSERIEKDMADINGLIAKEHGWKKENLPPAPKITVWRDKTGEPFISCPDYLHEANLFMPLYFELPMSTRMRLACMSKNITIEIFGKAICVNWLDWKGIKHD